MITQIVDRNQFHQRARQIRTRVQVLLSQWGLPPKFTRWRLAQDPETGLVVLFAVLDHKYIATHTTTPFSNYFDTRLLHDLANDLHVQVVFCNSDGLRYAFILDRGSLGKLPTHIDFPLVEGDRLLVGIIYNDEPIPEVIDSHTMPALPIHLEVVDDQTRINRDVTAFMKVLDDIKLKRDAAAKLSAQGMPDIVIIDAEKFNKRVEVYKANRQKSNRITHLFNKSAK